MSTWTPQDWGIFFGGLGLLITTAVIPLLQILMNAKINRNDKKATEARAALAHKIDDVAVVSADNATKIEQVHVATNSMKDALVTATASSNLAAGKEIGRAEGKAEAKADQHAEPAVAGAVPTGKIEIKGTIKPVP